MDSVEETNDGLMANEDGITCSHHSLQLLNSTRADADFRIIISPIFLGTRPTPFRITAVTIEHNVNTHLHHILLPNNESRSEDVLAVRDESDGHQ